MTSHQVSIRLATDDDVAFLTDVAIEATRDQGRLPADFDEADYRTGFADWTREQVCGEVPGSTTSVIEVAGVRAGRLRVVRTEDTVELAGIQLLPGHQSGGIGTAIVRELMREAASTGRRFELDVEKDNPRARALYERLGLVWQSETGDEDHLVWPDDVRTGTSRA